MKIIHPDLEKFRASRNPPCCFNSRESHPHHKIEGFFSRLLEADQFDWFAIVLLPSGSEGQRRIFIIPRTLADRTARRDSATAKTADERYWRVDEISKKFPDFENNYSLSVEGNKVAR